MKNSIKHATRLTNRIVGKTVAFVKSYKADEADKKLLISLTDAGVTAFLGKMGHRFDRRVVGPFIGRFSPNIAKKYLVLNDVADNVSTAIVFGKIGFAAYDWYNHKQAIKAEISRQDVQFLKNVHRIK